MIVVRLAQFGDSVADQVGDDDLGQGAILGAPDVFQVLEVGSELVAGSGVFVVVLLVRVVVFETFAQLG